MRGGEIEREAWEWEERQISGRQRRKGEEDRDDKKREKPEAEEKARGGR